MLHMVLCSSVLSVVPDILALEVHRGVEL
uniref:Uncharacterized protein n=1 Tax=Arundo donax TaxID=35708 RepID=A0A0A9HK85_ARUDO